MSYKELVACLSKEYYKYSLKLWVIMAICSLILFQLPLYYLYLNSLTDASGPYFWLLFFRNWCILMALSFLACVLSFKFTGKMYQSYWSTFGVKLGAFFFTELFVSMTLVPYFLITERFIIFPYYVVVGVMLCSAALGTFVIKMDKLRSLLRQREEALE